MTIATNTTRSPGCTEVTRLGFAPKHLETQAVAIIDAWQGGCFAARTRVILFEFDVCFRISNPKYYKTPTYDGLCIALF